MAIARLRGAKVPGIKQEEIDVGTDAASFSYDGQNCGETWFQWFGRPPSTKQSATVTVLVLATSAGPSTKPAHPPDPGFKSGLLSTEGTPLNPLPGRKINIFGSREARDFEDYSSDFPYCNTGDVDNAGAIYHRPWTDDPRKPAVGLASQSVQNICCRSSPIIAVTIAEIKRIAAPGCRVTFAGGQPFVDVLRHTFVDTGLATGIEEGPWKSLAAIIFQFK
jgi:hypothetical protein